VPPAQVPTESVWDELGPPAPFDDSLVEKHFALAQPRPGASAPGSARSRVPGAEEPRKRIRVLDDRTSQLLAIAFNRLPPPERLAAVVSALDDFPDCLPAEAVLALHAAVTEQREAVEQLRQLEVPEADLAQLDVPERYLWVLGSVPACAVKLACGALIVGPANELGDIRSSAQRVQLACQAFRSSELVRKCISTCLAVGNFMNRGTARSGARAVVLPEALLKLDELRGTAGQEGERDAEADGRVPSLLDVVAQALVDERTKKPQELCAEAEELRAKTRAVQNVCLDEAEKSCSAVCAASAKARRGLGELAPELLGPGSGGLVQRVAGICQEADAVAALVRQAKDELATTQTWSSARKGMQGHDWFVAWGQFLELFATALARAKVRPPTPKPEPLPVPSEPVIRGARRVDAAPAAQAPDSLSSAARSAAAANPQPLQPRRDNIFLDDEARIEDMDIGKMLLQMQQQKANTNSTDQGKPAEKPPAAAAAPPQERAKPRSRLFGGYDGKENQMGSIL